MTHPHAAALALADLYAVIAAAAKPAASSPWDVLQGVFVAALSASAGAVATAWVKEALDRPRLRLVSSDRRKTLVGTWRGTAQNLDVPGAKSTMIGPYTAVFHFKAGRRAVTGDATFHSAEREFVVDFRGGMRDNHYLALNYVYRDGVNGFGYVLFKMDDVPNKMAGEAVGYGPKSNSIVVATLNITKSA